MNNLRELLEERAAREGDRPFLFWKDREIRYGEINLLANKAANAFAALGWKKGDHVAVMLPNSPEYMVCWFGLAKIGAVLVAVNTQLKGESLRRCLGHADLRGIIFSAVSFPQVQEHASELDIPSLLAEGVSPLGHVGSLPRLLEEASPELPTDASISRFDPLVMTFTSGTTGMPKGVLNCHNASISAGRDISLICRTRKEDRIFTYLPLYHANPQIYCVMGALVAGASLILAERFSASAFWDQVRNHQATMFSYVGTILTILLKQPEAPREREHTVKVCFGGGAPGDMAQRFQDRFRVKVLELYGMSETGAFNTMNTLEKSKVGSVGPIREGFDVRLFNEEDEEVPDGTVGEFVIRPLKPGLMFDGYYKQPEETLKSYRNLWFHTGDLGRRDAEGFFYFVGRNKETIRKGGENISPGEIEAVLNDHPHILESAVVGVPDEILEEEIKAYIVVKEGKTVEPEEIYGWCSERLAPFMVPRYIESVESLPKTGSSKVQKTLLKELGVGSAWEKKRRTK